MARHEGTLEDPATSLVYRDVGGLRQLLLCHAWAMSEGTVAAVCFRSQRAQW